MTANTGGFANFMKQNQGAISGTLSATSNIMPPSKGGMAAKGALSGAAMGSSFGPIGMAAGAVIGGVAGTIKADKMKREASDARVQRNMMLKNQLKDYSKSILSDYPVQGVQQDLYRNGGMLSNDLFKFQGPSHEQGGIPLAGGAEVEGGEMLDEDNVVYSNKLRISPDIEKELKRLGI